MNNFQETLKKYARLIRELSFAPSKKFEEDQRRCSEMLGDSSG
jgi:hypothetical protein